MKNNYTNNNNNINNNLYIKSNKNNNIRSTSKNRNSNSNNIASIKYKSIIRLNSDKLYNYLLKKQKKFAKNFKTNFIK